MRQDSWMCAGLSLPGDAWGLTFDRVEEVEEGVLWDLLGDGAHRTSALVLLLLLDGFHRHVFTLLPADLAPAATQSQQ